MLLRYACRLLVAASTVIAAPFGPDNQAVLQHKTPDTSRSSDSESTTNSFADTQCGPDDVVLEFFTGDIQCATEDQKWDLKRQGERFFDISYTSHGKQLYRAPAERDLTIQRKYEMANISLPEKPTYMDQVRPLFDHIDRQFMTDKLYTLTSFHNRYYKSDHGYEASYWLFFEAVKLLVHDSKAVDYGASLRLYKHAYAQESVVVHFPGQTNKTIVAGAHIDDLNLLDFSGRAPGADDDASGCVSILETMRALLQDPSFVKGQHRNSVTFIWFSANEGGFQGSQDNFEEYRRKGIDVRAMIQHDMVGYTKATVDAGKPKHIGMVGDYVHLGLTNFTGQLIDEYLGIPWTTAKHGWPASDHSTAYKYGYPSVGSCESVPKYSSPHSLLASDTFDTIDMDQVENLTKLAIAFVYELMSVDI